MVTQPTCTPSRASILTGCFPSALRSRMVGCVTPDDPRFLPRVMAENGYHTASIGKIHLVPQKEEWNHVEQTQQAHGEFDYYGFQHVDLVNHHGMNCQGPGYNAWLQQISPTAREQFKSAPALTPGVNAGKIKTQKWNLPPEAHAGEYIVERVDDYLREHAGQDKPFFLHVSFNDPHHPFTVPEPYAGMYDPKDMPSPLPPVNKDSRATSLQLQTYSGACTEFESGRKTDNLTGTPPADYANISEDDWRQTKAIYYGMVTQMDDQIGRILQTLNKTGQAENTVVVFVSDHGEYLGDHGFCGKGFHYDSIIRTPLIIRGPNIPEGRRIDGVTSTVDLAPTLLDLASIPEPEALQGVSMRTALESDGELPRNAALTENDDDFMPMRARTLTTSEWKLTMYAGSAEGELYDRVHDPEELYNCWDDPEYAEVKHRLLAELAEHVVCAVDGANGRVQEPSKPVAKFVPYSKVKKTRET